MNRLLLDAGTTRKVIASARLLESDKPGEVVASVNAINRLLPEGQNVADVIALALADTQPPFVPKDHWWSIAQYCACYLNELNEVERKFVRDMAHRNTRPTQKQEEWLGRIHDRLERRAA